MNRVQAAITTALLFTFIAGPVSARTRRPTHVLQVYKSERRMVLEIDGVVSRSFEVGLGHSPTGDKEKQGDKKTPEGEFFIAWKNPRSSFHRFLGLSYPMPEHAKRGEEEGLIDTNTRDRMIADAKAKRTPAQTTKLGGYVGIHGGGAGEDWTFGCIAVTNAEAEFLFEEMLVGDRIVVHP